MASSTRSACSKNCARNAKPYGAPRPTPTSASTGSCASANPNLHDIPGNLPFRVELWDRHDQHIRWVIAASSSVAIAHAALDTAIATYPDQRFTLRNGILVIRQHPPRQWGE